MQNLDSTLAQPTDEEKERVIASLTGEQKSIVKRDFIVKHLSDTSGNRRQSHLLLEFATLHFPEKVKQIKELHNESYKKKHLRIEERIREIQPFAGTLSEEAATVSEEQQAESPVEPETVVTEREETANPETFDDPDMDDIAI